jgi:hypothetical protein
MFPLLRVNGLLDTLLWMLDDVLMPKSAMAVVSLKSRAIYCMHSRPSNKTDKDLYRYSLLVVNDSGTLLLDKVGSSTS